METNPPYQKVYKVKKAYTCIYMALLIAVAAPAVVFMVVFPKLYPVYVRIFFIIFGIYTLYNVYRLWGIYLKSKNLELSISESDDAFSFGTGGSTRVFSKKNIAKISCFGGKGNRGPNLMAIMKIEFTNGESISFPGMLIAPDDFLSIFRGYDILRKLNPRETIRAVNDFTK